MEGQRWTTWRTAMTEALYGENGFYLDAGAPRRTFRTSPGAGGAWATAIATLATDVDRQLGSPDPLWVVDIGAGGGELLSALAATAPDRWRLLGVDLAPRPAGLPERVTWTADLPAEVNGLVIANELLDVVPVDVAERSDGWARQVEVTTDGDEDLGRLVTGRDAQWLSSWWPLVEDGDRAEIGWPRDDLWRAVTSRVRRGLAVAVDYAADPARDVAGTLTGYREGRQVVPIPDGRCDLTAHVLFDSLVAPGDLLLTQREALQALGLTGTLTGNDDGTGGSDGDGGGGGASASSDSDGEAGGVTSYLAGLAAAADAAELLDPGGLGGFTWLLHPVGIALSERGVARAT